MANPYHSQAHASGRAKLKSIHTHHDAYARGGKTHKHVTNVIVPPSGAGGGPSPTMLPPPGMSSGPMPGMGPGGMQKRGGRVKKYAKGGRVCVSGPEKATLTEGEQKKFLSRKRGGYIPGESDGGKGVKAWSNRAKKDSYAEGGAVKKADTKMPTKKISDGYIERPRNVWAKKHPNNDKLGKLGSFKSASNRGKRYGEGGGMGLLEASKQQKKGYP